MKTFLLAVFLIMFPVSSCFAGPAVVNLDFTVNEGISQIDELSDLRKLIAEKLAKNGILVSSDGSVYLRVLVKNFNKEHFLTKTIKIAVFAYSGMPLVLHTFNDISLDVRLFDRKTGIEKKFKEFEEFQLKTKDFDVMIEMIADQIASAVFFDYDFE